MILKKAVIVTALSPNDLNTEESCTGACNVSPIKTITTNLTAAGF